jgi:hypothetical protein
MWLIGETGKCTVLCIDYVINIQSSEQKYSVQMSTTLSSIRTATVPTFTIQYPCVYIIYSPAKKKYH